MTDVLFGIMLTLFTFYMWRWEFAAYITVKMIEEASPQQVDYFCEKLREINKNKTPSE